MIWPVPPLEFTATPSSLAADAEDLVKRSRLRRDELVRNVAPSEATFITVMLPLAHMENTFAVQANLLKFFQHVSADEALRAASAKAQALFDGFNRECYTREDIFQLVDAVYQNSEELSQESSLLLDCTYNRYIRTGVGIRDIATKERFRTIRTRLAQIKAEIYENLRCQADSICFTPVELEGVPQTILAQLEKENNSDTFRIDLYNDIHTEILSYAESDETRRRLYLALENRCSENSYLVQETIGLRCELAQLLGFPSYAEFQLKHKMAKTPSRVTEFLTDLRSKLTDHGLKSLENLKSLKTQDAKCEAAPEPSGLAENNSRFFLWDYDFYYDQMLKKQLSIDRRRIQEYFPLESTTSGVLRILEQLFGLEVTEITAPQKTPGMVWHMDVQVFMVHDDQSLGGRFLGYLYLDLLYREEKCSQPLCCNLQPGFTQENGSRHYPATALLCAFPNPTSTRPSLLRHFDVIMMLHELGHGIHDLVSRTRYSIFHGPGGVPVDFGEIPSQMLEQWCWTPSHIKSLSFHYSYLSAEMATMWAKENEGEVQPDIQMSDTLVNTLIDSRKLTFGPLFHLGQLHKSIFDLTIHQLSSVKQIESMDFATIWNKTRKDIGLIDGPEVFNGDYKWGHGYATFSHLMMDDYAAGYYAYLYSLVYAADLFYSAFSGNILGGDEGPRYRQHILEFGGSRDGIESLIHFLGREPSGDAFIENILGL